MDITDVTNHLKIEFKTSFLRWNISRALEGQLFIRVNTDIAGWLVTDGLQMCVVVKMKKVWELCPETSDVCFCGVVNDAGSSIWTSLVSRERL